MIQFSRAFGLRHFSNQIFFLSIYYRVAEIPENNMVSETLSIILGPCIIYDLLKYSQNDDPLSAQSAPNLCIQVMIDHYSRIFEERQQQQQPESDDDDDNTSSIITTRNDNERDDGFHETKRKSSAFFKYDNVPQSYEDIYGTAV